MNLNSTLLRVLLFAGALLIAESANGQDQTILPLQVNPGQDSVPIVPGSLSFRTLRLAGSKSAASEIRPAKLTTDAQGLAVSDLSIPAVPSPGFYPDDVSNPGDGPVIVSTKFHPIYVNRQPSHWGNVGEFLTDLGASSFIHVLDQYIGSSASNRYKLGASFSAVYTIPENHTLGMDDILALVHAGAAVNGNGYGHLYHIFLPKGVDMCMTPRTPTSPPECYSPDNPSTFYFCGFHGSVTFSDAVGHVIFSVEPYQDVDGCSMPPHGTANSQLIDSTNNVLSHETSEAISDPDLDAWWVQAYTFANGNEIGDLCERFQVLASGAAYWDYGNVELNGHMFTIQPEYSNALHGCTYSPN